MKEIKSILQSLNSTVKELDKKLYKQETPQQQSYKHNKQVAIIAIITITQGPVIKITIKEITITLDIRSLIMLNKIKVSDKDLHLQALFIRHTINLKIHLHFKTRM